MYMQTFTRLDTHHNVTLRVKALLNILLYRFRYFTCFGWLTFYLNRYYLFVSLTEPVIEMRIGYTMSNTKRINRNTIRLAFGFIEKP